MLHVKCNYVNKLKILKIRMVLWVKISRDQLPLRDHHVELFASTRPLKKYVPLSVCRYRALFFVCSMKIFRTFIKFMTF